MSTGGWSTARLGRVRDAMAGHVERGEVPGLVMLVYRRGEAHADTIGARAFGGNSMRRDTIFRVSSLTKPVAAAAAMVLVEVAGCASTSRWIGCCRSWPTAGS